MAIFDRLKKLVSSNKSFDPTSGPGYSNLGHSINGFSIDSVLDDYQNAFGNVTKIVQGFSVILPKVINDTGKDVKNDVIIDKLNNPNDKMSALKFRAALSLMYLIHDEVYIRVHHKKKTSGKGKITPQSITGFTFLEDIVPTKINGKLTFHLPNGDGVITEDEVITISTLNPYNLSKGFSSSRAARRWAKLDDYIADYQTGFFRNGAVPNGMFIITSPNVQGYKEIKEKLEENYTGAKNNGKVLYSHRQVDQATGKADNMAQIEWVPFNVTNKDLALKDLLPVINSKIDSMYGVPAEIRGELQNSNYASVSTARAVFTDYTLRPHAMAIWDDFSHGLARITGGFGGTITFDLETPTVGEEKQQLAESKKTEAETIILMTKAGYTLNSIIEATGFDDKYKELKIDPNAKKPETKVDNSTTKDAKKSLTEGEKKKNSKAVTEVNQYVLEDGQIYSEELAKYTVEAETELAKYLESAANTYIDRLEKAGKLPTIAAEKATKDEENNEEIEKWVDENLTNDADEAVIAAILAIYLLGAVRIAGAASMAEIAPELAFDPTYEKLTLWLRNREAASAQLIKGVNDQAVLDVITKQIKAGDISTDAIAKALREKFEFTPSRAQLIAENEMLGAGRAGQYYSDMQSGKVEKKVWHGRLDSRERAHHIAAEGQVVAFDKPFKVDGDSLIFPTDTSLGAKASNTIRCRCNYDRVLKSEKSATEARRIVCIACQRYIGTVTSIEGSLLCKCGKESTY